MLEKIILAIAITLSLYLSSGIKPAPRFVGLEAETQVETMSQTPLLMML